VLGIAELTPGRFLLIAEGPEFFILDGARLDPIPISWDDPETSVVESAPSVSDTIGCTGMLRDPCIAFRRADVFRAVDVSAGVAWVVGCGGILIRVGPGSAQRIALSRGTETQYVIKLDMPSPPPEVTAIRAFCPDWALIGAQPSWTIHDRQLDSDWFFQASAVGGRLLIQDYAPNAQTPQTNRALGNPLAIHGTAAQPIALFTGGIDGSAYAFGDRERRRFFGLGFSAAAELPDGSSLVGAGAGRLLRITGGR
jgi:hypothetical protein